MFLHFTTDISDISYIHEIGDISRLKGEGDLLHCEVNSFKENEKNFRLMHWLLSCYEEEGEEEEDEEEEEEEEEDV